MNVNDRELLARTLQAEAGNQGYDGMLAAGSVIMNRANATGYGDGMRGVILKPGQFSAWNSRKGPDGNPIYADGEQGQDMAAMRASGEAYKAADALISGTYEDATGGATHYYNPEYSQPKWGQKAGGDWKRIGDHVFGFADAGKKPNPNQAIASDTMKALGSLPNAVGLLGSAQAANNTESKMIPEEKPRGLLGSLGIQKMEEGAEGEAGQRFFERDTFKDTAANLAQGFAAMGSSPALQKMTADVASQRTESKAKNKTMEFLRKLPNGEELIRIAEIAGPQTAMKYHLESRKAPKSTAAEDKIARLMSTGLSEDVAIGLADGRYVAVSNPVTNETDIIDKATGRKVFGAGQAGGGGASVSTETPPVSNGSGDGSMEGTDPTKATGLTGYANSWINTIADTFGQDLPAPEAATAKANMESLWVRTIALAETEFAGKPTNFLRERVEDNLAIKPGKLSMGPRGALERANVVIKMLQETSNGANAAINGNTATVEAKRKALDTLPKVSTLLRDYESLRDSLSQGLAPKAGSGLTQEQNDLLDLLAPETKD
jgi:hypothetical protein